MATCANCSSDALYTYNVTPDFGINYCQYHLPKFLLNVKHADLVSDVVVETPVEAPVSKSKKTDAPVDAPVDTEAAAPTE
jgi:hypothetical protein